MADILKTRLIQVTLTSTQTTARDVFNLFLSACHAIDSVDQSLRKVT